VLMSFCQVLANNQIGSMSWSSHLNMVRWSVYLSRIIVGVCAGPGPGRSLCCMMSRQLLLGHDSTIAFPNSLSLVAISPACQLHYGAPPV
jgi:hypothetical protein